MNKKTIGIIVGDCSIGKLIASTVYPIISIPYVVDCGIGESMKITDRDVIISNLMTTKEEDIIYNLNQPLILKPQSLLDDINFKPPPTRAERRKAARAKKKK